VPGLVVYRYDAPLCFANAENFRRRALAALDSADPPARWLLLNTEAIVELDVTAADTLHALCDELDRRGVVPALELWACGQPTQQVKARERGGRGAFSGGAV
jgi:MFS superfamily sulfate permease-like transporter